MACCFRTRKPGTTPPPPPPTGLGDRHPDIRRRFPTAVFYRNGGHIIDVTQDVTSLPGVGSPGNALKDGTNPAQTTAAFKAVWNFQKNRINTMPPNSAARNYIPYVPAGEYVINDTIIWDGDINTEADNSQQFRLIGERRDETIIRLVDNAPGFGAGTNKPMISNTKVIFNPLETKSPVEGLTLRIGAGNPGAVGIKWLGPNGNAMGDITIESLDPTRRGATGIYIMGCTQFWIHDITIIGCDVAIQSDHPHVTDNALEHITISEQRVAGFRSVDSCFAMRKVYSDQTSAGVPAVVTTGASSAVRMEDCEFIGGAAIQPAISTHVNSAIYCDNVVTSGYGQRVRRGTANVVSGLGNIASYVSARFSAFGATAITRLVQMADMPIIDWPAPADWAIVTDATKAQIALNSGSPGIIFKGSNNGACSGTMGTVDVPASVLVIFGGYGSIAGSFRLTENSAKPLYVRGFCDSPSVNQNGRDRVIVIEQLAGGGAYINASPDPTDKVFCTATSGWSRYTISGPMTFYGRMINTEPKASGVPDEGAAFTFGGGIAVAILGGKTESNLVSIRISGGSKVHILGFMHNQTPWNKSPENSPYINGVFDIINSQVNATGCMNGHNIPTGYERLSTTVKGGVTKTVPFGDLRLRPYRLHQGFIDHYAEIG